MASGAAFRQKAARPLLAAIGVSGVVLFPTTSVFAENLPKEEAAEILEPVTKRKSIYDTVPSSQPSAEKGSAVPYKPTPTDRLAVQIGHVRVALHHQVVTAEDAVNNGLSRALNLEHSFTQTIASLAPPRESNERVVPGLLYVLVGCMTGQMVTRNRNILLRATIPAAFGLGVAYTVLPLTMRNVGDLAWSYEKKYPVLAENHMRIKERIERFIETGKAHSSMSLQMIEDKVGETRGKVEDWVRKGR